VLYWRKPTGAKAVHRTLMKLIPEVLLFAKRKQFFFQQLQDIFCPYFVYS
jgi:hypothetical protein